MRRDARLAKAIGLFANGEYLKSREICDKIIRTSAGDIGAIHLKGRCEVRLGRYEEGVACLEKVLAYTPDNPSLMLEIGNSLRLCKKYELAISFLSRALAFGEKKYKCYFELGFSYKALGRTDDAEFCFRSALELNPACWISASRLSEIYLSAGSVEKAKEVIGGYIKVQPDNPHPYAELAKIYLSEADPGAALRECEISLRLQPAYTRGYAMKYIALTELGRLEEASYLCDFERLVQRVHAECPASFPDVTQFNKYLSRHILEHPSLSRNGGGYAGAVNGYHTGYDVLFNNNKELGKLVEKMIMAAVDKYVSGLSKVDPNHPVHAARPKGDVRLRSWAVVTEVDGFAAPHIHAQSWIGGAYYVQLPDDFQNQPTKDAGWIEFGRSESYLHRLRPAVTARFEPVAGDFIIFPGFFWHSTIPLESRQKRICMAFDIEPVNGWGN